MRMVRIGRLCQIFGQYLITNAGSPQDRSDADTQISGDLSPRCRQKWSSWSVLVLRGFTRTNTANRRIQLAVRPSSTLCFGTPRSIDSAGTSSQGTSTTLGEGVSSRSAPDKLAETLRAYRK